MGMKAAKPIFDVMTLHQRHTMYRPRDRRVFERAVRDAGGEVTAMIHPVHFKPILPAAYDSFVEYVLKPETYMSFLTRFEKFTEDVGGPRFVFVRESKLKYTKDWLSGLNISVPHVLIATEELRPTPKLWERNDAPAAWSWFVAFARGLGVSKISIIGETAYTYNNGLRMERGGCVFIAQSFLLGKFDVEVIHELTYPNIEVPYDLVKNQGPVFFSQF